MLALTLSIALLAWIQPASSREPATVTVTVTVHDTPELCSAAQRARPGTVILLAPGIYAGGAAFAALHGSAELPIVIAAADPAQPPVIRGGGSGLHLSSCRHVEMRDLVFEQQTGNGLNIDDGGAFETPAQHVVLRGLVVRAIGPRGNCDGIKLSGVTDFTIEGCTIERWGSDGSAIDLVGCSNGVIERCTLRNPADRATASGVQAKGGSRAIRIQRNRFEHAGERAVNIGGSTGRAYFRPPLGATSEPRCEAQDIDVAGNTFVGSAAPIAFVGVDGATVRYNTLYRPERWALRILQENREPEFVASRHGTFSDNLVVFDSAHWSTGGVNVGPGTSPESFHFERNVWTCIDSPANSRASVGLPVPEIAGCYGLDPQFVDAANGDLGLRPGSPAAAAGASAFRE